MKPYLEGPPDGALQLQLGKTYNEINTLYQKWLQTHDEEGEVKVEEEWDEDDEISCAS